VKYYVLLFRENESAWIENVINLKKVNEEIVMKVDEHIFTIPV
jgi:hypothetical protein